MIAFFNQILPALQTIIIFAGLIGGTIAGIYMFKGTRQSGVVQIQNTTIVAQQQQIDALKEQNLQQQEKIDRLEFKLDLVTEALKDEGVLITIDGEKITIRTIAEPDTRHIIRKPAKKTPTIIKKEES